MCKECGYYPCIPQCPNYENNDGYCINCNVAIPSHLNCYGDSFGNLFCSKDCFEEYYGLCEVQANEFDNED